MIENSIGLNSDHVTIHITHGKIKSFILLPKYFSITPSFSNQVYFVEIEHHLRNPCFLLLHYCIGLKNPLN